MKYSSEQEIFDLVTTHLLKQGATSFNTKTDSCMYRHNGLKCAVGFLIPDDEYDPFMEGFGVINLIEKFNKPCIEDMKPFVDILSELQRIHDTAPSSNWYSDLEELANDRCLEMVELTIDR